MTPDKLKELKELAEKLQTAPSISTYNAFYSEVGTQTVLALIADIERLKGDAEDTLRAHGFVTAKELEDRK